MWFEYVGRRQDRDAITLYQQSYWRSTSAKINATPIYVWSKAICQRWLLRTGLIKIACMVSDVCFCSEIYVWFTGNVQSQQVWGVPGLEACAAGLQRRCGELLICLLVFWIGKLTAKYVRREGGGGSNHGEVWRFGAHRRSGGGGCRVWRGEHSWAELRRGRQKHKQPRRRLAGLAEQQMRSTGESRTYWLGIYHFCAVLE